jgi:hypothetical protein
MLSVIGVPSSDNPSHCSVKAPAEYCLLLHKVLTSVPSLLKTPALVVALLLKEKEKVRERFEF